MWIGGLRWRTGILVYFAVLTLLSTAVWPQQSRPAGALDSPRRAALPAGLTLERSSEPSLPVLELGPLSDAEDLGTIRHGIQRSGVKRMLPEDVLNTRRGTQPWTPRTR